LHLHLQSKTKVRTPVAVAAAKLICVLPTGTERWQLPKVLQTVANLLAESQQHVRDDAREVLLKLVRTLGAAYMPFICDVLHLALPSRGYTAHVLGFTLHACLAELASCGAKPGAYHLAVRNCVSALECMRYVVAD
jgi:U3 small nucleolar RNA-associated protein 20